MGSTGDRRGEQLRPQRTRGLGLNSPKLPQAADVAPRISHRETRLPTAHHDNEVNVKSPALLRTVLQEAEVSVAPGIYNALTAQLVAKAGFKLAFIGGSLATSTLLGKADAGYITVTEMEFLVSRIARASSIPFLVDMDNGYGNALNAAHATQTMERAGAAGVIIEDQAFPTRTPGAADIRLVSKSEMAGKVAAVMDARQDPDLLIIARTDAYFLEGIDNAIDRMNAYVDAGADCAFVTGYLSVDELARIGNEITAPYRLLNLGGSSKGRGRYPLSIADLGELGFNILLNSIQSGRAATWGLARYLEDLQARGIEADDALMVELAGTPLEDWHDFTGFAEIRQLERAYLRI